MRGAERGGWAGAEAQISERSRRSACAAGGGDLLDDGPFVGPRLLPPSGRPFCLRGLPSFPPSPPRFSFPSFPPHRCFSRARQQGRGPPSKSHLNPFLHSSLQLASQPASQNESHPPGRRRTTSGPVQCVGPAHAPHTPLPTRAAPQAQLCRRHGTGVSIPGTCRGGALVMAAAAAAGRGGTAPSLSISTSFFAVYTVALFLPMTTSHHRKASRPLLTSSPRGLDSIAPTGRHRRSRWVDGALLAVQHAVAFLSVGAWSGVTGEGSPSHRRS